MERSDFFEAVSTVHGFAGKLFLPSCADSDREMSDFSSRYVHLKEIRMDRQNGAQLRQTRRSTACSGS